MERANEKELSGLHKLLQETYEQQIKMYKDNKEPIPPSLLASASRFLKDNGIDRPAQIDGSMDGLAAELESIDFGDPNQVSAH
jgi:hypothetical protein